MESVCNVLNMRTQCNKTIWIALTVKNKPFKDLCRQKPTIKSEDTNFFAIEAGQVLFLLVADKE